MEVAFIQGDSRRVEAVPEGFGRSGGASPEEKQPRGQLYFTGICRGCPSAHEVPECRQVILAGAEFGLS